MDKWHTNKTAAAGFHCSDTDFSLACVHMCVCVCALAKCYLFTHLCQSETVSCCPTLLLPWWTPFGLLRAHGCVCACVCLFMCATSWCAFNERCVHPCLFLWPFGAHACVAGCVPPGARVLCNQTRSQMWSRGVMSQRQWEEEVLVLF